MKIAKYHQIEIADEFLTYLFSESILETNMLTDNSFLDKLKIHKLLEEEYKSIINTLQFLTKSLVKNSNIDISSENIYLFCLAAFSVCILNEGKFIKKHNISKEDFVGEIRGILLEELRLSGVGHGLVETLSEIFQKIFDMSRVLFKAKNINDSFNEKYLLKSIYLFIEKYKLSINNFLTNFEELFDTIYNLYIKTGKLDNFKNKLSQISQNTNIQKVFKINEFKF